MTTTTITEVTTETADAPPPPRRTSVRIGTPGVSIQIDADEPMDTVSDRALQLFRDAGGCPPLTRGAIGFQPSEQATA